jgi:hypothetical protein
VSYNRPNTGHYARDGMAQASSFKSSIRYQGCNSTINNDISRLSSTKPSQQGHSSITDDDLCEITISPSTTKNISPSLSSPNHHSSSLTHLIPLTSSTNQKSSSTESTIVKIPILPSSSSATFPPKHPLGSSLSSIHSLPKRTNPVPQERSRHSSTTSSIRGSIIPAGARRSTSRQSVFDTLATKLTAARKSSTTALASAQQRLSTDNANLFSAYQGKR